MSPTPRRAEPGDELVQMNVRVPRSLREAIDARREELAARPENNGHFSRDRWVTNAIRNVLDSRTTSTATPPHRRGTPRQTAQDPA